MNKKIKAIIEFVKLHKKETIGVAVALGIAVIGIGGYAISNHYNSKAENNLALAEKKNTDEAKQNDEKKEDDTNSTGDTNNENSDVIVEEQEDGTMIVKDKEGNTIADSSKGDDVSKVVEEKKEAGSNVTIKNTKGEVKKVEKVENGDIKIASGETVTSKVDKPVSTTSQKEQNGEKVEEVKDIKGATGSSEGSITIVKPKKEEGSNKSESKPQENPKEEPSQPSQKEEKKEELKEEVKPVEPAKPVEKPQEPKPVEKQQRTWEYQEGMTQQLWSEFNAYRQSKGLNALKWSGKYASWTKQHAEEMAKKESTFHKSYPDGGQVVTGGNMYNTASGFLKAFKNSPQHNKNILDDELTEGACAVYKDSNGQFYVTIGFDY
ncbi:CAP domain-containing protein [Clostridium perfringens]|uniref:CAP domain-containing protein n=1 Tax=Clostridium perfringens TaxID=1502 RepID=UPI002247809C|nr:CAP domain-containing protein [Clostridium perfringens]MCX0408332.1 CAP domain-containing protein [Clostridium perfringens]